MAIAPLALATVAEQVADARRVQLVQVAPDRLHVRVEVTSGASGAVMWSRLREAVAAYLADRGVSQVRLELDQEPPQLNGTTGTFQQVIALAPPARA